MTQAFLNLPDPFTIPLPEQGGLPKSVHVIDRASVLAINAALAARRPLLVRGEPGTGKSQLARAAAVKLERAFIPYTVDGNTETGDLLFTVDAVSRLAEAQLLGALRTTTPEAHKEALARLDVMNFVRPGPLWWAFDWSSAAGRAKGGRVPFEPPKWKVSDGAVVLIDEIDKADPAVPNGLLDALGHRRFALPDGNEVAMATDAPPPLVVITTNEERALPDAFLRRCLVLHLGLPGKRDELVTRLVSTGRAHFTQKKCSDDVLNEAAELLATARETLRSQDLAAPGLAEYIDLIAAVSEQSTAEAEQSKLLTEIAKLALEKHPKEEPSP